MNESEGVKVDGAILDPHHLRADLAMVTQALKKGWPVPDEKLEDIRKKALAIVVGVPDGRLRTAAEKLLHAIEDHRKEGQQQAGNVHSVR